MGLFVFLLGMLAGQILVVVKLYILLRLVFPRHNCRLFSARSDKPYEKGSSEAELNDDPFDRMSEFFLKIYKKATSPPSPPIYGLSKDITHAKGRYNHDEGSALWLNEIIETAFFYYKTSASMHLLVKTAIERMLSEAVPSFIIAPEFDFVLGGEGVSHPNITDIYHERVSAKDLSDISIRFHFHWDNVGTFALGADATLALKNHVLARLPFGLGIAIDKISGYVFLRLRRRGFPVVASVSLHPNFILRLRVLSSISNDTGIRSNNQKIAQIVEWAIKQSLEQALVYPRSVSFNLSP